MFRDLSPGDEATIRFVEFFTAHIRNPNTRAAYGRAAGDFFAWISQAGIKTLICNHTFRATEITTYLRNGGQLEKAASMAAHSSTRTTQLYDRRSDEVSLDEIERIVI